MVTYEELRKKARLLKLIKKVLDGTEFVEVRLGEDYVGGVNLRIQGKTVHCNIDDVPSFSFDLPDDFWQQANDYFPILVQRFKDAVANLVE